MIIFVFLDDAPAVPQKPDGSYGKGGTKKIR
jgi:hypothetical protein